MSDHEALRANPEQWADRFVKWCNRLVRVTYPMKAFVKVLRQLPDQGADTLPALIQALGAITSGLHRSRSGVKAKAFVEATPTTTLQAFYDIVTKLWEDCMLSASRSSIQVSYDMMRTLVCALPWQRGEWQRFCLVGKHPLNWALFDQSPSIPSSQTGLRRTERLSLLMHILHGFLLVDALEPPCQCHSGSAATVAAVSATKSPVIPSNRLWTGRWCCARHCCYIARCEDATQRVLRHVLYEGRLWTLGGAAATSPTPDKAPPGMTGMLSVLLELPMIRRKLQAWIIDCLPAEFKEIAGIITEYVVWDTWCPTTAEAAQGLMYENANGICVDDRMDKLAGLTVRNGWVMWQAMERRAKADAVKAFDKNTIVRLAAKESLHKAERQLRDWFGGDGQVDDLAQLIKETGWKTKLDIGRSAQALEVCRHLVVYLRGEVKSLSSESESWLSNPVDQPNRRWWP